MDLVTEEISFKNMKLRQYKQMDMDQMYQLSTKLRPIAIEFTAKFNTEFT